MKTTDTDVMLALSITKAASKQTYTTIRFLVDRELVADAFRAYAYFRWVDDTLDLELSTQSERSAFISHQKSILDRCCQGEPLHNVNTQEKMLVELVRNDPEQHSGLQSYLRNMMAVMAFDAERRGRLISETELTMYTHWLACGVTEAMHYFIGHCCYSPHNEARYMAVTAAHMVHMLRDTFDDIQAGYFNIPREVLEANCITPQDLDSDAYQAWVRSRVDLARTYFRMGREYLNQVENIRCRLAGFAYSARFTWLLDTIEHEGYCLRSQYNERRSVGTGLRISFAALSSVINRHAVVEQSRA